MKTIITSLPIYSSIAKQCYERSRHSGNGIVPVLSPLHRFPSFIFQDSAMMISHLDLLSEGYDGSETSLATNWDLHTFDTTFTHTGLEIAAAVNVGVDPWQMYSNSFAVTIGDIIHIRGTITGTIGALAFIQVSKSHEVQQDLTTGTIDFEFRIAIAGSTEIKLIGINPCNFTFTGVTITKEDKAKDTFYNHVKVPVNLAPAWFSPDGAYYIYNGEIFQFNDPLDPGVYFLRFTMDSGLVYYSDYFQAECIYSNSDDILLGYTPIVEYPSEYLIFEIGSSCDLGDIPYSDGFVQTIWMKAEPMEMSFPMEEEGQKNGEGRFVRTFGRQVKKYLIRTFAQPDYMVEVFNRMKLCDDVYLTDLVGDRNKVYNIEVEHEWLFDDKYYAKLEITLDYDEVVLMAGCCISTPAPVVDTNITMDDTTVTMDDDTITMDSI